MQKVVRAIMAVIVLASREVTAQPVDAGLYLRFDQGQSLVDNGRLFPEDSSEIDGIDVGIGYRVNRYLCGDVVLGYRYEDEVEAGIDLGGTGFKKGGEALIGIVNVYADVAKFGMVTSYVGGGVGFLHGKAEESMITADLGRTEMLMENTRVSLVWQLMAGVDVDITPNWTIDGGYRYFGLEKANVSNPFVLEGTGFSSRTTAASLKAHEARVGIRYQF